MIAVAMIRSHLCTAKMKSVHAKGEQLWFLCVFWLLKNYVLLICQYFLAYHTKIMYCFYEKKRNTGHFILKCRVPVPLGAFDSDPDLASRLRFTEKGNLEVLLFTIQSKLRANNQKVYTPREGRLISDINKVHSLPSCPTGILPLQPQPEHPSRVQM